MAVRYEGEVVGECYADLLVNGEVLVELKVAKALDDTHMAQCLNYLRATGLHVCLLLNFARPTLEVKRIVNQYADGSVASSCKRGLHDPRI